MKVKLFGYLILSSLIIGCSSAVHYPNSISKNITINVSTDTRSSFFKAIEFSAGVNDLNKDCTTEYKGFINLTAGKNKLGLKTGVSTHLILEIKQDGFTGTSTFQQGTLIRPQKGSQYEVIVKYIDNMFDFSLYERKNSKRKKLKIIPWSACQSVK